MPTNLNSGFSNNVNILCVRTQGVSLQKLTDRKIDLDGDGNEEEITITHVSGHAVGTPSAPGGIIRQVVTTPRGFGRTIVDQPVETDGGVHTNSDVSEFTEGVD
jgi:hypothetical protein